jgi:hypothetical protein
MEYGYTPVSILESELPEQQQKAVDLLYMLQENLPDKTGKRGTWNFEKAHSFLHKVHEIMMWGKPDNTSWQAPEVHTWDKLVHTVSISTYSFVLIEWWYITSTYLGKTWYIFGKTQFFSQ